MELKLVHDLLESKMYRSKAAIKKKTARQVADHAFMDLLALYILYKDFQFSPKAMEYSARTAAFNNFKNFRQMGTDLYINLHILTMKNVELVGGSEMDQALVERMHIDLPDLIQYLRQIAYNRISSSRVKSTLQRLERGLAIEQSSYRSIRRLVQHWDKIDNHQKRLAITRMLMFYRVHAYRSEMYPLLMAMANANKLVDRSAKNPEISAKAKVAAAATGAAGGFLSGWALGKSLL